MPTKPIALTDIQRQEVETLAALLNQEQIADYLGIARNTFRAICERDPEVAERYKRGKARAIAHVAQGLLQKARGGRTTSSIFYLKTQARWRETERLEHSGPDGSPLEVGDALERLRVFLDGIAERMRAAGSAAIETPTGAPRLERIVEKEQARRKRARARGAASTTWWRREAPRSSRGSRR